MEIQNEIQALTISYFKAINSEITEDNGLYKITIPEKYQNYFGKSEISLTFDEKIALEKKCELILPGSKTLFLIITNCTKKGPISLKHSKKPNDTLVIRYHFFVNFSGTSHSSQLFHIDVNLKTLKSVEITMQLQENNFSFNEKLLSENIMSSYNIALDELKQKSSDMKTCFIDKINLVFQNDFKLFISRYDSEIRELDDSINKKEESSNDFEKIKIFRFETLDKIKKLEKEKSRLIDTLQEKHKVILDYNLVACEILSV